jgi:hypothetical protein
MGIGHSDQAASRRICLHPSVGISVDPRMMTPRQKVAAVAKIQCLEHDLFEDGHVRRDFTVETAGDIVARINELRRSLGWLEIDLEGHHRWPEAAAAGQDLRPPRPPVRG